MRYFPAAVLVTYSCLCAAQDAGQPEDNGADQARGGLHADATFSDVYVNDSFAAADALIKAQSLARQGRWTDAAALLQKTADAAGDQLVRAAPGSYIGVREHINAMIAAWPEAGIQAYRLLFEEKTEAALSAPRRRTPAQELLRLFDHYFNTASAAQLGDLIGQQAIESGDLSLAEYVYRRVGEHHPDRARHRERCQTMLALITAIRGGSSKEGTTLKPNTRVQWMGQDRPLEEALTEIGRGFSALAAHSSRSVWPMFGGNAQRHRRSTTVAGELGLLWQFSGIQPASTEDDDGVRVDVTVGGDPDRSRYLSIHPVVTDQLIVAQFGRDILALHRATGAIAWRFRADSGSADEPAYPDEQPPGWNAVTLYDGRVYASIPGDTMPYYSYESAHSPPELVCLNTHDGSIVWRVEQDAIEEAFAEIVFDSSPIVRHGHMYVVGRRRRSFGFEDCYLFRFNAENGKLEHRAHLGSASTGSFGSRQSGRAIAAMHGDTVFVCTNLGSIAAVSAHTGATYWLRLYRRDRADGDQGLVRSTMNAKPWHFNPVLWSSDRIVVFPTDATSIIVLRAKDGKLLHTIPASAVSDAETVLGIEGDLLYVAGRSVACYDLAADSVRWSVPLPGGEGLYGHGMLADDRLLIPTKRHLCAFALSDGLRTDTAWGGDNEGGNLLAMPDQILVAGAGRISAYVRKSQIWMALRERMTASPNDPLPALELAEIALGNGDYSDAVSVLGEAVRRTEHGRVPLGDALTKRFFDDVLTFVERLNAQSQLTVETLDTLLVHASRFAPDTPAHLRYRFRFAELFDKHGRPKQAVTLLQQILRDRTLRELPFEADRRNRDSAATQAKLRIAALIAEHGPYIYEDFNSEARHWLEGGQSAADLTALRRVVETFPNSTSAPTALIAHGKLLADRGDPIAATRYYSKAYHRYPKQIDRPDVLRKIADAYEAGGQPAHAYLWLTKAVREYPAARIEHNGRRIRFVEYREHLAHVRDQVEPSRPSITLPLVHQFETTFEGSATLLMPRFGDAPASDLSRFFVFTSTGIMAYDAASGAKIWIKPVAVRIEADLLIATADICVFKTSYEVFGLDARTGERRWSYGDYPDQLDQAGGDWENEKMFRSHAFDHGRLVSVRDDGEFSAIAIETGTVLWSQVHRPEPAGRLRLSRQWLVYHVMQDGHVLICLIDANTGEWSDAIHTQEQAAVVDIFVTLDEQLVLVTSQAVLSYDPQTRARRWSVSTDGQPERASLLPDLDALYFSDDGRSLKKISLEDGRLLWESQRLTRHADDNMNVQRQDGGIIVSSINAVSAVDAVTGLTLWQGAAPDRPRFLGRLLTRAYFVAVDIPRGAAESENVAYFYDHRNASGVIARDGGALKLGPLTDIRTIMAVDGALLIQAGQTIRGWKHD